MHRGARLPIKTGIAKIGMLRAMQKHIPKKRLNSIIVRLRAS